MTRIEDVRGDGISDGIIASLESYLKSSFRPDCDFPGTAIEVDVPALFSSMD